jgi:hypothetical protein
MTTMQTLQSNWKGKHALLGAVAFSAAIVGAAIGIMAAGMAGAIGGAVVGLIGGLLAGKALEDETAKSAAHDREIDDELGVIGGDIGAQEIASSRLSRPSGSASPGELLHADQVRLERLLDELVASMASDGADVRARWDEFEHGFLVHLATEEMDLYPGLRQTEPDEVDGLMAEHAELRRLVALLGDGVATRVMPTSVAHALIERLRSHDERESRLAYPWADSALSSSFAVDVEMRLHA